MPRVVPVDQESVPPASVVAIGSEIHHMRAVSVCHVRGPYRVTSTRYGSHVTNRLVIGVVPTGARSRITSGDDPTVVRQLPGGLTVSPGHTPAVCERDKETPYPIVREADVMSRYG